MAKSILYIRQRGKGYRIQLGKCTDQCTDSIKLGSLTQDSCISFLNGERLFDSAILRVSDEIPSELRPADWMTP